MMVETGRILEAEEAHREGLIDDLVEKGEALPKALEYAKRLASGPSGGAFRRPSWIRPAFGTTTCWDATAVSASS